MPSFPLALDSYDVDLASQVNQKSSSCLFRRKERQNAEGSHCSRTKSLMLQVAMVTSMYSFAVCSLRILDKLLLCSPWIST